MANETIILEAVPALAPLFETVRLIIQSLQWLVGGIFGLYLVLIFLRWRESRIVAQILKEIRDDLKQLTEEIRTVNDRVDNLEKKKKKR